MTRTSVLTSSGLVKNGSGQVYSVQITKVATGTGTVDVYDNTTNSGTKIWSGDGLSEGSFDLSDSNGTGAVATQGIYVALGGTTNATVVVVYQ